MSCWGWARLGVAGCNCVWGLVMGWGDCLDFLCALVYIPWINNARAAEGNLIRTMRWLVYADERLERGKGKDRSG